MLINKCHLPENARFQLVLTWKWFSFVQMCWCYMPFGEENRNAKKTASPYLCLKINDSVALSSSETWSNWSCWRKKYQVLNHQACNLRFLKSFCKNKTKLRDVFRHKLLRDEGFEICRFPWDLVVPNIFSQVSALLKGEIVDLDMSFNSKRKMGWYLRTDNSLDFSLVLLRLMECTMFKGCSAFHKSFFAFSLLSLKKKEAEDKWQEGEGAFVALWHTKERGKKKPNVEHTENGCYKFLWSRSN